MSESNGHVRHDRDVAHERAFTVAAAALIERSPVPIRQLAEERAPLTELRDFLLRDFAMDALEELADCRNYIAWLALRIDQANRHDHASREARAALQRALAHAVEAFAQIILARSLLRGVESVSEHA